MDTIRKDVTNEELLQLKHDGERLRLFQKEIKKNFHETFDGLYMRFINDYIDKNPNITLETLGALQKYNEFLKKNA